MVPVGRIAELADPDDIGAEPIVVIDTDDATLATSELARAVAWIVATNVLTVAVTRGTEPLAAIADAADVSLALGTDGRAHRHPGTVGSPDPAADAATVRERAYRTPRAALTLAWLLRNSIGSTVPDALAAESATYSMLLGSAEFAGWLAARGAARGPDGPDRVRLDRAGDELTVTLARPHRRNAVDARMRDALHAAFELAAADPALRVTLRGDGPSFCAGGDLDEFGTAGDPAAAHLVRFSAGPAALLHRIRDRVTARVHGACVGAGVELPAFAGRVVATPDAVFTLPELAMGLIPGAGGTVSLPRRIGRARTLWLALCGEALDVRSALAWGLVDQIGPP